MAANKVQSRYYRNDDDSAANSHSQLNYLSCSTWTKFRRKRRISFGNSVIVVGFVVSSFRRINMARNAAFCYYDPMGISSSFDEDQSWARRESSRQLMELIPSPLKGDTMRKRVPRNLHKRYIFPFHFHCSGDVPAAATFGKVSIGASINLKRTHSSKTPGAPSVSRLAPRWFWRLYFYTVYCYSIEKGNGYPSNLLLRDVSSTRARVIIRDSIFRGSRQARRFADSSREQRLKYEARPRLPRENGND